MDQQTGAAGPQLPGQIRAMAVYRDATHLCQVHTRQVGGCLVRMAAGGDHLDPR